ncbi:MAG: hypothetical protein Q8L48_11315 [Archangium sp.]|nr:hypothetical protein [Archangium sp.]
MRKLAPFTVLWLAACSPEDLAGLQPRGNANVNEVSHTVAVRFDTGAARLKVKRQLRNDSPGFQALNRHLALPDGAIATSLRVGTNGRWPEPGTLTSSEDAAARWDLLTSPGNAAPSTLGMLQWSWSGGLDLDLFGLAPGATVDVEYDVELSPEYDSGELHFDLPREDPVDGWLPPQFELGSAALTEVLDEEGEGESTTLRLRQPWSPRDVADVRWATFPIDTDRTLWRLEIDAAAELERAPVRPNVVFVVDASHSEGAAGIAAQLELIAPYLENARDAQVEIVIYRRFAERLFGRFVAAADVARLLAATPAERLVPGNGSNLERGAGLAAQALAQVGGTGRVVLFTDEQLRHAFSNDETVSVLRAAPRDTVVHVVARGEAYGAELDERRDDDAPLSPIAAAHGGIFLRVDGHAENPVLSADTLLGLVRPIRIDSFAVEAAGLDEALSVDSTLREGSAVRQTALSAQPPAELTLTGKIWAREYRRVVTIDPGLANRLPGIAVGDDDVRGQLSDDELRTVAFVSHAVSPVTSYLAVPPDAAPSTVGQLEIGSGGLGMRGFGCSGCGGSTSCGWGRVGRSPDFEALLRALLDPGVAACAQRFGEQRAHLRLEATADEVVDVAVTAQTEAMSECLAEAAWAVRLSPEFRAHSTFELGF